MKRAILTAVLLVSCLMFKANAQVSISLGLNIGNQPEWGPVGYDHAEYYYIPDAGVYYDVPRHQYVYPQNNVWIHANILPARYHVDPYRTYKVVINDRNPWERDVVYRRRYVTYRGRPSQVIIRDSREPKYNKHWQDRNRYDNRDDRRGDRGDDRRGPGNSDYGHDKEAHGNGHGNGHGRGHDDK